MWQPWVPHVDCVRLLELHGLTGIGAFVAACATGCAICRGWIATSCWPHHLSDERMALLSNKNPGISRVEAAGSFTSALASASGLSRTMAMSISPPSFWIRAGRPACISARIATAVFSHRVRSHFSSSLCQGASLWWGHVSCRRSQCTNERTVRQLGRWQTCDSSYCT